MGRALLAAVAATAIACMFNSTLYDDLMGDYLVRTLGVLLALGVRQKAVGGDAMNAPQPTAQPRQTLWQRVQPLRLYFARNPGPGWWWCWAPSWARPPSP